MLSTYFPERLVLTSLAITIVGTGIFSYVWIEYRGLLKKPEKDAKLFSLTNSQRSLFPLFLSHSIWLQDYESKNTKTYYTALELELIEQDKLIGIKITRNHPELKEWPIKSVVQAKRCYENMLHARFDWDVYRISFIEYLYLCELNGSPFYKMPTQREIEQLFLTKE